MRGNNIVGIILSYINSDRVAELTKHRVMASVPFGGRYRIVDFVLSNMVNSGINKVGVITDYNYQSLMDHLGSGKAWDLSRKREGLFLLPPFISADKRADGKLESLRSIKTFLENCNEEYVIVTSCDTVYNMNYMDAVKFHNDKDADITVIYRKGTSEKDSRATIFDFDENGKICDLQITDDELENVNLGMNMYIMRKDFLKSNVSKLLSRNVHNFDIDLLFSAVKNCNFYGYEFKGACFEISSKESYYHANMALMNEEVREDLFKPKTPIYTKVRDEMPARYGINAKTTNSLVADGCIIEGEVENCVLFRGVHVKKGAKLKNCVIMQDSVIEENARLECIIADKNVIIQANKELKCDDAYHCYVEKGAIV